MSWIAASVRNIGSKMSITFHGVFFAQLCYCHETLTGTAVTFNSNCVTVRAMGPKIGLGLGLAGT